jgi:pilus assembly protein TadC
MDAALAAERAPMTAAMLAALCAVTVLALATVLRPPPGRVGRLTAAVAGGQRARAHWAMTVVAAALVPLALAWPPLIAVVAAVVLLAPRWRRARAARRRAASVARALPDTIDLVVLAISAGMTPALAVRQLAGVAPAPFDAALGEVVRRVDRGERLADALAVLPEQLGDGVRPMVSVLVGSERYGAPLGPALDVLAFEARRERRRRADEAVRRLPVTLCFPLVCCTLPAFVLLTVAPLLIGALGSLHL